MSAPLLDQLARYGNHLDHLIDAHLDGTTQPEPTPGRSPRSRRIAVSVAAVSVLAAAVGLATFGGSNEPAQAWAGWSATVQITDLDDLAELDTACRRDDTAPLVAVDVRGDGGAVLYADDDHWMLCQATRTSTGTFEPTTRHVQRGDDLAAARATISTDRPIVSIATGRRGDPAASFAWGVRDRSLAGVELTTTAATIETSLHDDIWLAWWPEDTAEAVHAVGRDRTGQVVIDEPAGTLAAPLPDPDDIAAQIAVDATPLEHDILADGIVTWPELQEGLDAWEGCVTDAGYELIIEIDHDTRTYQAASQIVSVPAPRGQPDDLAAEALLEPIMTVIDTCRHQHLSRIERIYVQQ